MQSSRYVFIGTIHHLYQVNEAETHVNDLQTSWAIGDECPDDPSLRALGARPDKLFPPTPPAWLGRSLIA